MHSSTVSRRIAVLLACCSMAAGLALLAAPPQSQSPAPPPRGASARELIANGVFFRNDSFGYTIPQTGDSEVDAMVRVKAREQIRADVRESQRILMEAARQKRLADMKVWRGTIVSALPGAVPNNLQDVYETVAPKLASAPTPALRNELFAKIFGDNTEFKCLGWNAYVNSIHSEENHWEVTIHFRPQLGSERHIHVHTPLASVETWRLTSQGDLQFVSAKKEGIPMIAVD
jgi:hypothetical protein